MTLLIRYLPASVLDAISSRSISNIIKTPSTLARTDTTSPSRLWQTLRLFALVCLVLILAGVAHAQAPQIESAGLENSTIVIKNHDEPFIPTVGGAWTSQGPAPTFFGQVENVTPNDAVVGAVNQVIAHPTNPDILVIGAANGGVWKTTNATSANPVWENLTDSNSSPSIGALEADPYDSSFNRYVAGIGRFSSFGAGGARTGLLQTHNGGQSWREIDGDGTLLGKNIIGVAPRGGRILVAVNSSDQGGLSNVGVFEGYPWGEFERLSLGDGSDTGLPSGLALTLASDPQNAHRLFTAQVFSDLEGGQNGVYRTDNTGWSWTKVSDAAIDALLISGVTSSVEITVGHHNNVYVAIANGGALAGVFRSGDGGNTWTALDLPVTFEDGGVPFGIHPGFQAFFHFSLVADPGDPNLVYIGGDRQPFFREGTGNPQSRFFPNSIGANDFSGRLFRGDASQAPGAQWAHLTHSPTAAVPGGGTASNSSPHADSRDMTFDAAGNLIEVDDGGVYRRTSPRDNTGDWVSINGDLATTELHAVSYDPFADVLIGGAQDTGVPVQLVPDQATWSSVLTADGGDVAVDSTTLANISIRYSSNQFLGNFNRTFWDANNNFLGFNFVALQPLAGSAALQPQFYTPIELNAADQLRIVIGAQNSVYESFDRGQTITEIGPGIQANGSGADPIAYGTVGQPDVLYVGSGDQVFVRETLGNPLALAVNFPGNGSGSDVSDIVLDPADGSTAFVASENAVYVTANTGATWTDLTGNLGALDAFPLRSIAYVDSVKGDAVVVGGLTGAFIASDRDGFSSWSRLGQNLPNVPVYDLSYGGDDNELTVGTLGRGAFTLNDVSQQAIPDELIGAYDHDNQLQSILTTTGVPSPVTVGGQTLFLAPEDITGAAREGDFIYLSSTDDDELYKTDLTTGTTTLVGPFGGFTNIQAIDIAPPEAAAFGFTPGTIYGISIAGIGGCSPNCLYSIDKTTGAATVVGGLALNQGRGMSFDPVTGELWVYDQGSRNLVTVDGTGQVTFQWNVPAAQFFQRTGIQVAYNLAHSCDGQLYAFDWAYEVLVRLDSDAQQGFWITQAEVEDGSGPLEALDGPPVACLP